MRTRGGRGEGEEETAYELTKDGWGWLWQRPYKWPCTRDELVTTLKSRSLRSALATAAHEFEQVEMAFVPQPRAFYLPFILPTIQGGPSGQRLHLDDLDLGVLPWGGGTGNLS